MRGLTLPAAGSLGHLVPWLRSERAAKAELLRMPGELVGEQIDVAEHRLELPAQIFDVLCRGVDPLIERGIVDQLPQGALLAVEGSGELHHLGQNHVEFLRRLAELRDHRGAVVPQRPGELIEILGVFLQAGDQLVHSVFRRVRLSQNLLHLVESLLEPGLGVLTPEHVVRTVPELPQLFGRVVGLLDDAIDSLLVGVRSIG